MRGYMATTAPEIAEFLASGSAAIESLYAPTIKFQTANVDLDEEESEYTLSLLAAEEALELRHDEIGPAFVLALEVPEEMILEHSEISITLKENASWKHVECAFLVSEDGEELTWFATQEIPGNLKAWLAGM
jgi:hypothetical protein